MEGLFQPSHLIFILIIILLVVAPIAIPVRVARCRRRHCTWPLAKAKRRLLLGLVALMIGVLGPALMQVLDTALLGIACWFLFATGVYQIAKAVYRKRDIKTAEGRLPLKIQNPG
jgi:hypothetical protein